MWEKNENGEVDFQCLVEKIPHSVSRPPLEKLYEKDGRSLEFFNPGDAQFLKLLYAARIASYDPRYKEIEEYPHISLSDISTPYEEDDPEIFERLEEEIAFVVEKTALDE